MIQTSWVCQTMPNLRCVDLATMIDPRYLGMTNMFDLITNKQREQLCILVVRRERDKKNTNNLSLVAIQPLSLYMCHTMWKRARLRF
jgi:hypothetical protein